MLFRSAIFALPVITKRHDNFIDVPKWLKITTFGFNGEYGWVGGVVLAAITACYGPAEEGPKL